MEIQSSAERNTVLRTVAGCAIGAFAGGPQGLPYDRSYIVIAF